MSKKSFKIIKYVVSIMIFIIFIYVINRINIFKEASPTTIKEYLNSFGMFAPIIYIIIFIFVPLTLFPDSILAISGGLAFGLFKGFIYTMIGAIMGASLSFFIARFLGRAFIKKIIGKNIVNIEEQMEKKGFVIILLLRMIPLFPFDVISYSAGLSKIKFRDFIFATVVGTIPGILVYTNLGDKSTEIGSKGFYISIMLLVILFAASIVIKKKVSFNGVEDETKVNNV